MSTAITSDEELTPLWLPLYIQSRLIQQTTFECRFNNSCYIDYMKIFDMLIEWLSPIEFPKYGAIPIPRIFRTFELQMIAGHLEVEEELIYTCMVKEVIPRLEGKIYIESPPVNWESAIL